MKNTILVKTYLDKIMNQIRWTKVLLKMKWRTHHLNQSLTNKKMFRVFFLMTVVSFAGCELLPGLTRFGQNAAEELGVGELHGRVHRLLQEPSAVNQQNLAKKPRRDLPRPASRQRSCCCRQRISREDYFKSLF